MTDWIEHNGGPQPVGDDVWVELRDDHVPFDIHLAKWVDWGHALRYRILNQHLIDAARLEGIRLGLDAAARACLEKAEYFAHNDAFVVGQPLSNTRERYACVRCAYEIRDLNPDTIARDVQTSSHQEKCDNLHIAREAQDMGSDTSASTSA